jgi:hypothetical protein
VRAAHAPIHALFCSLVVCVVLLGACSGAATTGLPVGVSDAVPERSRPAPKAPPRPRWPDFEIARAWPEAAPASASRAHFRDGTLVHVRVEPSALDAYRKLATDSPMPSDARVVAWHESRAGQLRGGYVLEKRQGVWGALELDAAGGVVPVDSVACLRCHEMAPTDHLFGPPHGPGGGATAPESIGTAAR